MRANRPLATSGGVQLPPAECAYTALLLLVGGALGKRRRGGACPGARAASSEANTCALIGRFTSWRCGLGANLSTRLALLAPSGAVTGRSRGVMTSLRASTSALALALHPSALDAGPCAPSSGDTGMGFGVALTVPS